MAEPFLSEIRIFSFNWPPKGWAFCNGQLLPINQNQALFALLGTSWGGNGQTNFALPNLQGRVPMHAGSSHNLAEAAGTSSVTLTQQQMPQHVHFQQAGNGGGASLIAGGNLLASFGNGYDAPANLVALNSANIANVGGSQPHNNMSPYLVLNFCIALQGIFPSQN